MDWLCFYLLKLTKIWSWSYATKLDLFFILNSRLFSHLIFVCLNISFILMCRHFRIAFKMFDLNGDGTIEADEFEKVTNLLRSNSRSGFRRESWTYLLTCLIEICKAQCNYGSSSISSPILPL